MGAITLKGDWRTAKEVLAAGPKEIDAALTMAVSALAEYYVGKIKRKMGNNLPPPNSPLTLLFKGSSKTLVNNGDLRNSVTAVDGDSRYSKFIGIPRTVRTSKGKPTRGDGGKFTQAPKSAATIATQANLADVLENGRTIVMRITPKQLKWLHATLGRKVSKVTKGKSTGILVIHIPPRPFIQPVFDEELPGAPARFEGYIRRNLKRLAK